MVKALVIGDCHFKTTNVKQMEKMTEAILSHARKEQPDFIVMLGDTLDRHESIHTAPLCQSIAFIRDLTEIAMTFLLIGNHDRPNNSDFLSPFHPFTGLKGHPRLVVVDEVVHWSSFIFVPYVPPGRFHEALGVYEKAGITAVFAHQEFRGAKMGAIVSTEGDEWPLSFPLVISGHVHDYDELQPNLIYVGTPIQHAFGDREDKTISLFTFEDNIWSQSRIDLCLPKKKIFKWSCEEFLHTLPTPPEEGEIKLILRGTAAELKTMMKHPALLPWISKGVKIAYQEENPEHLNLPSYYREQLGFFPKFQKAVEAQKDSLLLQVFGELFSEK